MNLGQKLQKKDINLMKDICSICYEDCTSHSFNFVCSSLEGGQIFYTKISNASKYGDTDGIVNHCENYLKHYNPSKWSWIIDFNEFGFKHTLGINTGLKLSRLINRFGRLNHVLVINTNAFVEQMLKLIKLTLNKEFHNCIRILHANDPFHNEIEKWTCENKDLLKHIIVSTELS